jgi:hypothetical protein
MKSSQKSGELAVEERRRLGYVPIAWIGLMHGPGGVSQPRGVADKRAVHRGFELLIP